MSLRGLSRKLTVLDLLFAPQLHSTPSSALLSLGGWPVWTPFLGSLTFQFGLGLANKKHQQENGGQRQEESEVGYTTLVLSLQRCRGLAVHLH